MTRRARLKRNRKKVYYLRIMLVATGLIISGSIFLVMSTIAGAVKDLPDLEKAATQKVVQTSKVYDKDNKLITTFHAEQNRVVVPLKKIPRYMRYATISIEDRRYYQHRGVDFEAIIRAVATNLGSGSVKEGGSTLTQQYVKKTLLTDERTFDRKIKEAFLAYEVERKYDKNTILEKYFNTVYFGSGNYGVETAAEYFFGKKAQKLNLPESALLAGLIRSPLSYSPYVNPRAALKRRNRVIKSMLKEKYITAEAAERAIKTELKVKNHSKQRYRGAYFVEYIKSQIMNDKRFGATEQQRANTLFRGGLRIYTTLDIKLQTLAEESVKKNLGSPGDPAASMVTIEPKTGYVKTMVGGRDFFGTDPQSKFNLAYQGRRQTGSSFKVFVFVAALLKGMTPNKAYATSPVSIPMPGGAPPWNVNNYTEGKGYGNMTIAQGTIKSVNTLYARLIMDVGPKNVVKAAHKLGISSYIEPNPAIALGGLSKGVSPFEMAVAIATLANNGVKQKPIAIIKVVDPDRKVLLVNKPKGEKVISAKVAATATAVLQGVVQSGTGVAAKIQRPAAGKTGTAQNYRDAWFIGYTPDLATSVWVGYPNMQKEMTNVHGIRVTGGSFPAKIWRDFMLPAHEKIPIHDFPASSFKFKEIISYQICKVTNKLATEKCPEKEVYEKTFPEGKAPKQYCDMHGDIKVPEVVGLTKSEASSVLKSAGFNTTSAERESIEPKGTVIDQSPAGGSNAGKGATVTIYISKGPKEVSIPDVVNKSENSAISVLGKAGLAVSIKRKTGTPEQKGLVISQGPAAGSKADEGTTVTIVIGS